MRFDAPERPSMQHLGETLALHTSGSALPSVTLVRPIYTEREIGRTASGEQEVAPCWGWLACIHAHRGANRYGYHTGIIPDLGRFGREWLEDPEACLVKYFKYTGPEETTAKAKVSLPDLWAGE